MQGNFKLKDKRVAVVGLGLTGRSCVEFLLKKGAQVVALDSREHLINVNLEVPVYLGEYDESLLLGADLVLISPGVDPSIAAIQAAVNSGVEVIGDVELFARFNTRPVVAITGSNGKSTVTSLVTTMLNASGQKALMGGNIGTPVLDLLEADADIFVLELSSFQLETVSSLAPVVATILNVCDDHLDRHGNMENYQQAKQRIYSNAANAVFNRDDPLTIPYKEVPSFHFGLQLSKDGFGWNQANGTITFNAQHYLAMDDCLLTGTHNVLNIQVAAACAAIAGASDEAIKQAARVFGGLPHRFETVASADNIRWINDSKATNVGATIAAIKGLVPSLKGKLILIAGGEGKGADFSPLQNVFEQYVQELITLGKDGDQIGALKTGSHSVQNLSEAVQKAAKLASSGDVVLLSPACASLDMFDNYQQRGEQFAQAVKELAA